MAPADIHENGFPLRESLLPRKTRIIRLRSEGGEGEDVFDVSEFHGCYRGKDSWLVSRASLCKYSATSCSEYPVRAGTLDRQPSNSRSLRQCSKFIIPLVMPVSSSWSSRLKSPRRIMPA